MKNKAHKFFFYFFSALILANAFISFGRFTRIAQGVKLKRYYQVLMFHNPDLYVDKWYYENAKKKRLL